MTSKIQTAARKDISVAFWLWL